MPPYRDCLLSSTLKFYAPDRPDYTPDYDVIEELFKSLFLRNCNKNKNCQKQGRHEERNKSLVPCVDCGEILLLLEALGSEKICLTY